MKAPPGQSQKVWMQELEAKYLQEVGGGGSAGNSMHPRRNPNMSCWWGGRSASETREAIRWWSKSTGSGWGIPIRRRQGAYSTPSTTKEKKV